MMSGLAEPVGAWLRGGIVAAASRTRPPDWDLSSEHLSSDQVVAACLEQVTNLSTEQVEKKITELHHRLAERTSLLRNLLFGSDPLIAEFPKIVERISRDVRERWVRLCWLVEAAWRAVTAEATGARPAPGDRELLYPLAARLRFEVLCIPMRYRGSGRNPWLPADDEGPHGQLSLVFGSASWNTLVGRCRTARQAWLGCLDSYQSHPFLAAAEPGEFEKDVAAVVFANRCRGRPLVLSVRPLRVRALRPAEDRAAATAIVDRHLLPRFRLVKTAYLAGYTDAAPWLVARCAVGLIALLGMVTAVALTSALHIHAATVVAGGVLVLLGLGTAVFGPLWSAPWLLRMPAAGALGLAILVTLPNDWWDTPRVGWAACTVLAAAGLGYLVVEATSHGVLAIWAILRTLGVAILGVMQCLLVTLIGLVAVAPAFVERGDALAAAWRTPTYGQAGMVLLLATLWAFAVGVFSQILWEDRPVTARLAHLDWKSGRSR